MPMNPETKDKLLQLLKTHSVFHGDFALSSGGRSRYYVDCKLTTMNPEGAWLVGNVMYDLIHAEVQRRRIKVDGVGGLTLGADPIALAIGMISYHRNPHDSLQVFTVRKSAKAHGQTKLIEGRFRKGDRVVVIDDVVTKGDSTLQAIEAVRREGGIVEFAAVLVDRQEGGRDKIEAKGLALVAAFNRTELLGPDDVAAKTPVSVSAL